MSQMYSRGERCLRKSHQLRPEMWDYYQSLPLRSPKKRTHLTQQRHQKQSNKKYLRSDSNESSKSQRSVEHNFGLPIVTITNPIEEQPPILRRLDTDLRFDERMIDPIIGPFIERPDSQSSHRESPQLETSETQPSPQISSSIDRSGEKCFRYLNACKQLTEIMESEGLDQTNMKTVLKYALIKSFLGDIDLTFDAIKSASKDMIIGTSYDIESRSEVRSNGRADTQTRDNKPNWSGRLYTPQPKYDLNSD